MGVRMVRQKGRRKGREGRKGRRKGGRGGGRGGRGRRHNSTSNTPYSSHFMTVTRVYNNTLTRQYQHQLINMHNIYIPITSIPTLLKNFSTEVGQIYN